MIINRFLINITIDVTQPRFFPSYCI